MKLKSFGCSFIFGNELSDTPENAYPTCPSRLTWPALLAQQLDFDYECYAWPGIGNLQIFEQVLNQSAVPETTFMTISWTWPDRFDYYDKNTDLPNKWATILPADSSELSKIYYRDLHSDYQDKIQSLTYMAMAIDIIKKKNIPFIMTIQDPILFETRWHYTPAIMQLQAYVSPYITWFDKQVFGKWSQDNGYAVSNKYHPLDDAHRAAAEYMLKFSDIQNIVDSARQVRV